MPRPSRDTLQASYTEYVLARQTSLRRIAYAMTGDWHRAEDLLQQALTKLYVAWPKVVRKGTEDAYVRRIMLNSHLDERRRPRTRREQVGLDTEHEPSEPPSFTIEDRDELVAALQLLPPMQRKVVVLRHLADLTVAEIADELHLSPGTVKSHTARGLTRLQRILSADDPTAPSPIPTNNPARTS